MASPCGRLTAALSSMGVGHYLVAIRNFETVGVAVVAYPRRGSSKMGGGSFIRTFP